MQTIFNSEQNNIKKAEKEKSRFQQEGKAKGSSIVWLIFLIGLTLGAANPEAAPIDQDSLAERPSTTVQGGWEWSHWLELAQNCADTILQKALDHEGKVETPLWIAVLDPAQPGVLTQKPPNWQTYWDAEDYMMMAQGCNLYRDQPMLSAFETLSRLSKNKSYNDAVAAYLGFYLKNLPSPKDDLFPWGEHMSYNVARDRLTARRHELEHNLPEWELLWSINQKAVQKEIEALYKIHIWDKENYYYDRHGDYYSGEFDPLPVRGAYIKHSGLYAYSFLFLYSKTNDTQYLEWARNIGGVYWKHRDPRTNLVPGYISPGGSGGNSAAQLTLAYYLLKSLRFCDDQQIRETALNLVDAYLKYGFNPQTGKMSAFLNTQTGEMSGEYLDPWSWGENAYWRWVAAFLEAYKVSHNETYLNAALSCGKAAAETPIPKSVKPETAGKWITLYTRIYDASGQKEFLLYARKLADWSAVHLVKQNLILESADGYVYHNYSRPGFLMQGWLDLYNTEKGEAFHWTAPAHVTPQSGQFDIVTDMSETESSNVLLRWKTPNNKKNQTKAIQTQSGCVYKINLPNSGWQGLLEFEFVDRITEEMLQSGNIPIAINPNGPTIGPWELPKWIACDQELSGRVKVTDPAGVVKVECRYKVSDQNQGIMECQRENENTDWYECRVPVCKTTGIQSMNLCFAAWGTKEWPQHNISEWQAIPISHTLPYRPQNAENPIPLPIQNGWQGSIKIQSQNEGNLGEGSIEVIPINPTGKSDGLPRQSLNFFLRFTNENNTNDGVVFLQFPLELPAIREMIPSTFAGYIWNGQHWEKAGTVTVRGEFVETAMPVRHEGVYAFGGESNQLWRRTFNGALLSSPAAIRTDSAGKLAVILDTRDPDGKLFALDAQGNTLWTYDTDSAQPFPVIADFNQDGIDEIVIGGRSLVLLNANGKAQWSIELTGINTPAIGDINGDGKLEIAAATRSGIVCCNSGLGKEFWRYKTDEELRIPVLAELDKSGTLSVIVGGDRSLFAFSSTGDLTWKVPLPGKCLFAPAVGDIGGDVQPEIFVFSRTDKAGYITCFDSTGTQLWEKTITRESDWSPVLADVLGTGHPQLMVQSASGTELLLLDGHGETVHAVPIESRITQSPVPVNLNLDGQYEILTACNESRRVWAYQLDGTAVWSYTPHSFVLGGAKVKGGGSLLVADIDGNGYLDVLGGDDETWLNAIKTDTRCTPWQIVSGQYHGNAANTGFYVLPESK